MLTARSKVRSSAPGFTPVRAPGSVGGVGMPTVGKTNSVFPVPEARVFRAEVQAGPYSRTATIQPPRA